MTRRWSIVVPVLDEAPIVESALERLQPLRAAGAELIVVDGGSRDRTPMLAAPVADRVAVAPAGRARQMNVGAALASGAVLVFLHVDSALPTEALDAIDVALAEGGTWGRFDVAIEGASPVLALVAAAMNLRSRVSGIATGDQAIFVTRPAFAAVGGFPDQPLMEDIELSRRLRRTAAPACIGARVVTSGRRWQRHGVWRTIALMWRLRLLYRLGVAPARLARSYR